MCVRVVYRVIVSCVALSGFRVGGGAESDCQPLAQRLPSQSKSTNSFDKYSRYTPRYRYYF